MAAPQKCSAGARRFCGDLQVFARVGGLRPSSNHQQKAAGFRQKTP